MGCDDIQASYPFQTFTGKSLNFIISELRYQGALSEDQARRMPEEDLRKYAERFQVKLHKDKEYNYVDYYPINNLFPDVAEKLRCHKDVDTIAKLNHVEVEFRISELCIKGPTRDSVERTKAELESLKESFYPFVGKRAYPFR